MANESTYALISGLIPAVWENALWYAQHNFVMPSLVTTFTDMRGFVARNVSEYVDDSASIQTGLGETDDLTAVAFDRDLLSTLTPTEIGKQHVITDRRVDTDPEGVMADAARGLGYSIGKSVETSLMGDFASLTGGIYGNEDNAFSMAMLYQARTRLEAAAVQGPYTAVIHPYQWLDIFNSFVSLSNAAPLDIRNQAQRSYYITQVADFNIVVSSMVPTVAVQNEIQTATLTGIPTGGTFKLAFGEQATAAIAFDATAATVELAIEALTNVGSGNCTVTGSAGGPWTFTFGGDLASINVPTMTLYDNSLTGGTTPSVTIAVTQEGKNYARAALFARDALAFDLRRGLRIEPERDASLRHTELNATMVHAHGVWRPTHGVVLKSDASQPLGV